MKRLFFLLTLTATLFSFSNNENFLPTNLKITVLNDVGTLVEGAKVTLYNSDEDYRSEKNAVMETMTTNEKGQVTFKKLEAKIYFVLVKKGDLNNDGGAAQTNKLEEGKLNKVNIIIE